MPAILVTCPVTGETVPTGLNTDTVVFESLPVVRMPLGCSSCGRTHFWKRGQARVDREGQPPHRWRSHSSKTQAPSRPAPQKRADARTAEIAAVIAELRAVGVTSLQAIAVALNERRIPSARGNGAWSVVQVMRVLSRISSIAGRVTRGKAGLVQGSRFGGAFVCAVRLCAARPKGLTLFVGGEA